MSDYYTPKTEQVRRYWQYGANAWSAASADDRDPVGSIGAEFDRWLSVVKAEAMQKGYELGSEQGHNVGYNAGVYDFFTARQSND